MLIRKLYYFKKVMRQQWMKEKDFKELQNEKIRSIVKHAYTNVPFYRKKWKELHIRPENIKNIEDLKKLPIISRADVKTNINLLIAENLKNIYETKGFVKRSSSGTTGIPLEMAFDRDGWDYSEAIYLRSLVAAGYNPRKPLAYYWYEDFKPTFYNKFGFMRKILIRSSLDEGQQLEILEKLNPEYMYYFGNILFSIAKKMKFYGIAIKPKALITHAEVLSKKMRHIIEDAFQTKVFDQYGTTEFNRLAWECDEHSGYHIDTDSVIMEFLDDNEEVTAGERGEAVITGLSNFLLPLIRYDMGDIIVPSATKCDCGRILPLIECIEGRWGDTIKIGPKLFSPRELCDVLADIEEIEKFKFGIENNKKIIIFVVLLRNSNETISKIKKRITEVFNSGVNFEIKIVNNIQLSSRGKRNVVEKLNNR